MELPKTYRAYQYDNYGPPAQELKLRQAVELPALGPKQVRIQVVSAAINPVDYALMVQPGLIDKTPSPEHPLGFGHDGAGTVVEVGSEAKRLKVGDQVYAMTLFTACGSVADFVAVDEDLVALKPSNLSFDQAAAVPLVGLTSYQMLLEHAQLQKGETVLILGGSSATGIFAVQLAHAVGARVIATTSAKNAEFVKSLGADRAIDYHAQKWVRVLEKHSVDVIYDCGMEADAWNTDAQLILKKQTGRFITLLPPKQPVLDAKFGATNFGFISVYPTAKGLDKLTAFLENGTIVPVVDTVFPFEKLQDALTKLTGRHSRGKLIVRVAPEASL
jgi:NADPH:quinone reductase-like Zn-dependent oxidoreductase